MVEQFLYLSQKLNREIRTHVLLPKKITIKTKLLYFLHGAMENGEIILQNSSIEQLAEEYDTIVVIPDVGNSFYVDVAHEFIVSELVPYIQKYYGKFLSRNQTIIGGYSMGGFGAFFNAWKRQDLFSCAFSLSGSFDISFSTKFVAHLDPNLPVYMRKSKRDLYAEYGLEHMLSDKLEQKYYISCGKDDLLTYVNRRFVAKLEKNNIPHEYYEKEGSHDWMFWKNELIQVFHWINKVIGEGNDE